MASDSYKHEIASITKMTTTTTTTTAATAAAATSDGLRHDYDDNSRPFLCGVVEGFYGKPWSCSQRTDLFKRMKELKMNTFMYGPKDDAKHRAKWRQRYNDLEVQQLKMLIEEAAENSIDFYYALAPGLDMVYSNDDDAMKICDKFSQLRDLGCKSFALLFDDIEPSVTNQKDKAVFNDNYALAQVLITNVVYEYLGKPNFLFCPTEYCESRAVPNVADSNYLNMIGSGLQPGIDIMWSGSRVISRYITEESIEQLTRVIRRRPVIWENLHANDYDRKRVYLGPFSGRSTKLIPKLRGILTNPNCEFEANYVAIHTLAQWSRCNEDINPLNKCNQPVKQFEEQEPTTNQANNRKTIYDPHLALQLAIRDWLPHLLSIKALPSNQSELCTCPRSDEAASNEIAKEVQIKDDSVTSPVAAVATDQNVEMSDEMTATKGGAPLNNNRLTSTKDNIYATANLQTSSDFPSDSNTCDSCEMMQDTSSANSDTNDVDVDDERQQRTFGCGPGVGGDLMKVDRIDLDSLSLLADFYFLPFEHGPRGHAFLVDIKWLMDNSGIIVSHKEDSSKHDTTESTTTSSMTIDHEDPHEIERLIGLWLERQQRIDSICNQLISISSSLINKCPNKPLIAELRPYLSDLLDMTTFIGEYMRFLRDRKSESDRFEHPYWSCHDLKQAGTAAAVSSDEQEPWVHRGGLIGDIHRLICSQ